MGNYIPYFRAILEYDRRDYDEARRRATVGLERCLPDYLNEYGVDLSVHGLHYGADTVAHNYDAGQFASDDELSEDDEEDLKGQPPERLDVVKKAKERADDRLASEIKRFLQYAASGDVLRVQRMLIAKRVPNIDICDQYGRSAIFLTAERGHDHCMDVLIQAGAKRDLKACASWLWSPLHAATFHGQVKCMDLLLRSNHDVNVQDAYGCTPLTMAASSPKLYLVDLVNKADRRKRAALRNKAEARANTLRRQQTQKSGVLGFLGMGASLNPMDRADLRDPFTLWRFHTNRIELMVLELLLSAPKAKVDIPDKAGRTPLLYAAMGGRHYALSRLLAAKADLYHFDKKFRTALWYAVHNAHVETVKLLILAKSEVNAEDGFRRTPLHEAIANGQDSIAKMLMEAEADVQVHDCQAVTPIMLAMQQQHRRLFAELLQRGADLDVMDSRGWNVVIHAIETGMYLEILPALERMGDQAKAILRLPDPQARNAIHHATLLPNLASAGRAIELLISLDPEAAIQGDCNGDTSLHMAAQLGRLEILQKLLDGLPSGDVQNNRDETPLHTAAHGGHMSCVLALLHDRGAGPKCDANKVDCDRRNVLMHACISGHLDLVNLLLQNREGQHEEIRIAKIDVNQTDRDGMTPLMIAAQEGHWEILPSLVLAGCSVAAKDRDGFTALHWAAIEDEVLAVSCLLEMALDIDAADMRGWTPLMHAVAVGANDAVRLLVDAQADLGARNGDGDTVLQICLRRKPTQGSQADQSPHITRDILMDGVLERDHNLTQAIPAQGHFAVSVIRANELHLEGSADVNPYICLQFCPKKGAIPQVAFTSCVLANSYPTWNEVFRFQADELDPSGYLAAWVMDAPGESAEEVVECAQYGVGLTQMRKAKKDLKKSGTVLVTKSPDFNTALEESFKRIMDRADLLEEQDAQRMLNLEMARQTGQIPIEPMMDQVEGRRGYIPLEERRWTEVNNLRRLLQRTGVDVPEPLAPRAHTPLGFMVVRFRQLRASVWGTKPVELTRVLRLGPRATLELEVDFRPSFFAPHNSCEESAMVGDEDIYTIMKSEAVDLMPAKGSKTHSYESVPCVRWSPLEDLVEDPIGMHEKYRKYKKVAYVTGQMLEAQEKLAGQKRSAKAGGSLSSRFSSFGLSRVRKVVQDYHASQEEKKKRKQRMDEPLKLQDMRNLIQAKPQVDNKKKAETDEDELQYEPWLLELLDSSRFV